MRPGAGCLAAAAIVCGLGLSWSGAHAQDGAKYGALAIDRTNGFYYGFAVDYDNPADAERRAVEEGNKRGGDTSVVLLWSGSGCGAYRSMNLDAGQGDAYGWGVAGTRFEAEAIALREANKRSNGRPTPNSAWACNSKTAAPLEILKDAIDEPGGRDMVLQHPDDVSDVAFSPDGTLLATVASGKGGVRLYDPRTGKLVRTLEADGARYLAVSSTGTLAAVAFEQITLWNPKTGAKLAQYDDEDEVFSDPAFLADGVLAVEGAHDTYDPGGGHVTSFFDGATAKLLRKIVKNEPDMHSHGDTAFSPDGSRVVIDGNGAEIWDAASGKLIQTLQSMQTVHDVAYSPSGRLLAVTGTGIEIRDGQSNALLRSIGSGTGMAYGPVFFRDDTLLVTGHRDGAVRIWDVATGREVRKMERHTDLTFALAVSPDGRLIASGGQDGTVRIWDAETGKPLKLPAPSPAAARPATPTRTSAPQRQTPAAPSARNAAAERAEAERVAAAEREAERRRAAEAEQAAADKLNQQILARDNEIKAANEKAAAEAAARQEAFRAAMAEYEQAKARNDAEVAAAEAARRKFEADKAAADAARAKYEADMRAYEEALKATSSR